MLESPLFRRSASDHTTATRRRSGLLLAALVATVAVPATARQETAAARTAAPVWTIGEREVPPPAGASDALRAAIAAAPAPNADASRQRAPADRDQWLTMQRARRNAADLEAVAAQAEVAIQREEIAGVSVYRVTPERPDARHADHLFLHVHGGAYVFGGGDAAVAEAAAISGAVGIPALSIDYRMPPEHPFPAAVDDVVAVYRSLLEDRSPRSIVLGGTSAGGGLALASVHRFRSLGLALPGAVYAGTPWADLTKTGDTEFTNEGIDRVLVGYEGLLESAALLYADGHDLTDPLLSPVYGDFAGFPPTVLVTGTRDLFLSDTARTHRKLRAAGVVADLHVFEGMSHAEYLFVRDSTEAQQFLDELGQFFAAHLSATASR